jgi:hypothetical protein
MAKVIKGNFSAKQKKTPAAVYQLKITLLDTKPPIWRRVQVPGSMTLSRLHDVIQLCMGWTDSHLHQFMIGNNFYGPVDLDDDWRETKALAETRFKLCDLEDDMRLRFMYEYDFGDGWQHKIKIEKVIAPDEKSLKHPVLLAGKRACPPEDIGGPPGYEGFLAAISDPENKEHEEMRDWYGSDDFDPDFFAIGQINKILKKIK